MGQQQSTNNILGVKEYFIEAILSNNAQLLIDYLKNNEIPKHINLNEAFIPITEYLKASPLMACVQRDHVKLLKVILPYQDITHPCHMSHLGESIVHIAARNCKLDILRMMLDTHRPAINMLNSDGNGIVHLACESEFGGQIIDLIVEYGGNLRLLNNQGIAVIGPAIKQEKVHVLKKLLEYDPGMVNEPLIQHYTPLNFAAYTSSLNILEILIEATKKCNLTCNCYCHNNLFNQHYFANTNLSPDYHTVKMPNFRLDVTNNRSPLHYAVLGKKIEAVERLIKAGCNVNSPDSNHTTPLHIAAENGSTEVAKILIDANAKINTINAQYKTPAEIAQDYGNMGVYEVLNSENASLNK